MYKHATKNINFSWLCYAGRNTHVLRYAVLIILTFGLIACGDTPDADLRQFVSDTKAKKRGIIKPLPAPQKFEIYTYNEDVLRNPFVPAKAVETADTSDSGLRPDNTREKDVLEEFALGSLKMMGSLEKSGKRWALLRAPDGTLHRTSNGRHIGQNNGKIIKISESELELKEIVPDGLGGWIERLTTLTVSE